eukprot:scaffold20267_cov114-Isochrysis_galbana.AAC.7
MEASCRAGRITPSPLFNNCSAGRGDGAPPAPAAARAAAIVLVATDRPRGAAATKAPQATRNLASRTRRPARQRERDPLEPPGEIPGRRAQGAGRPLTLTPPQ